MPDREKIVKAFEECLCKGHDFCSKCYQEGPGLGFVCKNNVCLEVLSLLKEQEAVEPYSMNAERTYGICPKCGKIIFRYGNVEENHYCGVCGQAVKWDG